MADKPDPYVTVAALVSNAAATARVLGDSERIVSLVVSSVRRLALELDADAMAVSDSPACGRALVSFALECVRREASSAVRLEQGLAALLNTSIPTPSP